MLGSSFIPDPSGIEAPLGYGASPLDLAKGGNLTADRPRRFDQLGIERCIAAGRIRRHPGARPLLQRGDQGILGVLLGQTQVLGEPGQPGDQPG